MADALPLRLETMQGGRAVGELGFYLGTRRARGGGGRPAQYLPHEADDAGPHRA